MKPEQITAPDATHGEGPVWSPDWGGLRWVDMLAGDVLHLDRASGVVDRWHVGKVAAALRPRRDGGMVIATEHDFVVADAADVTPQVVATPVTDPDIRFNDGGCDPHGRFWCGTMSYTKQSGRGTLYRLAADRSVDVVLRDVTTSNGLAWTADGTRAYYVDSPTRRVDVFDYEPDGQLHNRRPFAHIDTADDAVPDGLTVDADGGVWVALFRGGAVRHYTASGELADVITLPVPKVTACTFGGDALDELYITTSREGDSNPHPAAGAVFRVHTGVRGQPALPFHG